MTVLVTRDRIIKKSRTIKTSPSLVSVKTLKFNRQPDYNKLVNWISSSDRALKKVKLPKKRDLQGLSSLVSDSVADIASVAFFLDLEKTTEKIGGGSKLLGGLLLGTGIGGAALGTLSGIKRFPKLSTKLSSSLAKIFRRKPITNPFDFDPQNMSRAKADAFADMASDARMGKGPMRSTNRTRPKVTSKAKQIGGQTIDVTAEVIPSVAKKVSNTKVAKLGVKGGSKGFGALPLIGNLWDLGSAVYRFNDGDTVGGMLSLGSAIPILGWGVAAVDMARDMGAFDGTSFGLDKWEQSKRDKEIGVETKKELEKIKVRGPKSTFISPIIEKFGLAVDDFVDIISSGSNTTVNSSTQKKSNENNKIKKVSSGISSNFLGGSIPKVNTPSRVVRNGGSVVQKEGNPFKRFWNWFVPPPEKSAEPSVRTGVRTPETGFKHVPSMSNGDQLFGSGNTIIMVPENQSSVQPQSKGGIIPVPIASGGGGGVAVVTPSESEIVNSLWTNILLTKLAQ